MQTNHIIFDIKLKQKINYELVDKLCEQIVKIINLKIIKKDKHIFPNGGFTFFYILAESHISAHYRIENDFLALDIYSGNIIEEKEKVFSILSKLGEVKDKSTLREHNLLD